MNPKKYIVDIRSDNEDLPSWDSGKRLDRRAIDSILR